jgi:DNA-directed RNA polymerase subunit M/transcription elongation factor TFIIS
MQWLQRKAKVGGDSGSSDEDDDGAEGQTLKRKAMHSVSKFRPVAEIIQDGEVPSWAEVDGSDSFQYTSLFCQACGSFLDLRQKGRDVHCGTCNHITACKPGSLLMQSHAVVKYPMHKQWMEKLSRSKARASAGAQRAEVSEECPKCKNPRMCFCSSCDQRMKVKRFFTNAANQRYSINS